MNDKYDKYQSKWGAVVDLLRSGRPVYLVAAELKVPAALVRRWRTEAQDQQQATLTKIITLVNRLGDDPATWSPTVLAAVHSAITSLQASHL